MFYDGVVKPAKDLKIGEPKLPRLRRPPKRLDDGSCPHEFTSPLSFYRKLYFEADLQDRFDQQQVLPIVLAVESLVLKAAKGEDFRSSLEKV